MNGLNEIIFRLAKWTNVVAGIVLTGMMLLTVADVILRSGGKPIIGSFELVAFCGAVVIGFSMPFTSWVRGHIYVDFFIQNLPQTARIIFHLVTRCLGIGLFLMIGWNLIKMGMDLSKSGEVSPTLQMPFYPVVYGIGICCLVQCLVLIGDIGKVLGGKYE